jgi:transcriptional regulator with XRE-family HTH domain
MMMPDPTPPLRRRLVGTALRRHRSAAGYSLDDAARLLDCHRSKISRIETGQRGIRTHELRYLLAEYGVTGGEAQTLLSITRIHSGWWRSCPDGALPAGLLEYAALEPLAGEILSYEPHVVPDLLQTGGYASAVAGADPALHTGEQRDHAVAATLARQQALAAEPPELAVVIGEAALRHTTPDASIMREQLRLLAGWGAPGLPVPATIQVLPFAAGPHAALRSGPLSILRFRDAPSLGVAYQAGVTGGASVTGDGELAGYLRAFQMIRASALSPDDSRKLIRRIAAA